MLNKGCLVTLLEHFLGKSRPRDPFRISRQNGDFLHRSPGIALFPFTTKGVKDSGDRRKKSLFLTKGEKGFRAGGKDCVQQCAFFEKQGSEL